MSRTLSGAIMEADALKPNAFTNAQKTAWINSLEGRIQADIWLLASTEFIQYSYEVDKDKELLVEPPHDDIYVLWLLAQIDTANGEATNAANSIQLYNDAWSNYMHWFVARYDPAQSYDTNSSRAIPDSWL